MAENDPLGIAGQLLAEKYRIECLVGEGGFAVVYRAEHVIWKQPVAVKFFSGLSQAPAEHREALQQQFIQEGALLTELSSQTAGIVQARDVGAYTTPAGQWVPYMVLEWLEGSPLDAILEQDQLQGLPWTEEETVGFLLRILPVLDVAHRRGIAHRDIKPANIFILGSSARSPETPCKLLDFGVAKMVSDHAKVNAALARTGLAITSFTPQYGAPEQFTRSYGATGPWTDVFSIALVATEMLAGRVALQGEDLVQLGFAAADPTKRPTPRVLGVRVSDQLEAVLRKALAVHPKDRFPNAGEFLDLLAPTRNVSPLGATLPVPLLTDRKTPPHQLGIAQPSTLRRPPPSIGSPRTQTSASTTMQPEPLREKESLLAIAAAVLVVLAIGTVLYSATDLKGAKEARALVASVVLGTKRVVGEWFDPGHHDASPAASATPTLPSGRDQGSELPECPPGTRLVGTEADVNAPADQGSSTIGSPVSQKLEPSLASSASPSARPSRQVRCIDEDPVSEVEYEACSSCEKVKPGRPWARSKTRPSAFCTTGKNPADVPIQCLTWKQANAYCQHRGQGLPTEAELGTVIPATGPSPRTDPREWTGVAPAGPGVAPFRCVGPALASSRVP